MTNKISEKNNSFPFEEGDRVCFIGDSITHGNYYMSYIYEYYLTRFPEMGISLYNCGIAGDRALLALERLEYDVMVNVPNKVVVMFGANDIERQLYNREAASYEILRARETALKNYRDGMEKIIRTLSAKSIKVILTAPTPYDQTAQMESDNNYGCDDALARCAQIARELAGNYGCNFIDLHEPMNRINRELQKIDPANSVIGPDRIHPTETGALLMAYFFLKQQGGLTKVALSEIGFETEAVSFQQNCEVSNIAMRDGSISFDYKPYAFPLYRDRPYAAAEKLAPLTEELNSEIISVKGLPPGEYMLVMDGKDLGVYSHFALDTGVNIAAIPDSPTQAHSKIIHQANLLRHRWEQKLRTIRFAEYNPRNRGIDMENAETVREFLELELEKIKDEPYYQYIKDQTRMYYSLKPDEEQILRQIEKSRREIRTKNVPVSYQVSLFEV